MGKVPKRLKLAVPNVPAVYADEISNEEWKWIKTNYPSDYEAAQGQMKAHAEALEAQEAPAAAPAQPAEAPQADMKGITGAGAGPTKGKEA